MLEWKKRWVEAVEKKDKWLSVFACFICGDDVAVSHVRGKCRCKR